MERSRGSRASIAPSIFVTFGNGRKLDIRAHQRTYEGSYMRASIAVLMFALTITKLFSREFLSVATLFTVYGCLIFAISLHRSKQMKDYYAETTQTLYYKTSGNFVLLLATITIASYIALLVLILRM